jgi:hypothetical protein
MESKEFHAKTQRNNAKTQRIQREFLFQVIYDTGDSISDVIHVEID